MVAPPKIQIRPGIVTDQLVILALGKTLHLAEGQNVISAFMVIQKPSKQLYARNLHSSSILSGLAI